MRHEYTMLLKQFITSINCLVLQVRVKIVGRGHYMLHDYTLSLKQYAVLERNCLGLKVLSRCLTWVVRCCMNTVHSVVKASFLLGKLSGRTSACLNYCQGTTRGCM